MSLVNFEAITEDLTELELKYSNDIKEIIEDTFCIDFDFDNETRKAIKTFSKKPIKQPILCKIINGNLLTKYGLFVEVKLNTVRLRKYFNYFRSNGILPLIATSDGCYISNDKEEIEKQIVSMKQRARQIDKAAEGMRKFLL